MRVVRARNVHQSLPEHVRLISTQGIRRESRNGPVLVLPEPVTTVYERPLEKVEAWALRDSNPTFHLMEALWMLAGRDDVAFPSIFNSSFGQFSDDGRRFNGAYGHRWRRHFDRDQLPAIAAALRANPDCRRQVLAMWDARRDLSLQSKDLPCNTHAYFGRDATGRLDLTVCCRSNDIIWGLAGSNAVHFAFLQEYVAARIGCPVGTYRHISNNYHAYLKTLEPLLPLADRAPRPGFVGERCWDPYQDCGWATVPLLSAGEDPDQFDAELCMFLDEGMVPGIRSHFLRRVAGPLQRAYHAFRDKGNPARFQQAKNLAAECEADDWRTAAIAWFDRRAVRAEQKEAA